MSAEITIELPGPPQGKGRPRFVRATGHAYTPRETRLYEIRLRAAAQAQWRERPLSGALCVTVEALFPIPQSWSKRQREKALSGIIRPTIRYDYDNIAKIVGDSLNGVVWQDDRQITTAVIRKRYSDRPRLMITVREDVARTLFNGGQNGLESEWLDPRAAGATINDGGARI